MKLSKEYKGLTADTKRLLARQEGHDVDFKVKPDGVKAKDFVAFANGRGGTILVGVAEETGDHSLQKGIVVGCSIKDEVRQAFISTATSCRPSIDILVRVENTRTKRPIYRIDIPEGADKPYCTSSGLYKIRGEGQNIGINPTMMRAIILERESEEFVARFKAAADELLKQIAIVHSDLAEQIAQAEFAASMAIEAAQAAEQAAIDAQMMAAI